MRNYVRRYSQCVSKGGVKRGGYEYMAHVVTYSYI